MEDVTTLRETGGGPYFSGEWILSLGDSWTPDRRIERSRVTTGRKSHELVSDGVEEVRGIQREIAQDGILDVCPYQLHCRNLDFCR